MKKDDLFALLQPRKVAAEAAGVPPQWYVQVCPPVCDSHLAILEGIVPRLGRIAGSGLLVQLEPEAQKVFLLAVYEKEGHFEVVLQLGRPCVFGYTDDKGPHLRWFHWTRLLCNAPSVAAAQRILHLLLRCRRIDPTAQWQNITRTIVPGFPQTSAPPVAVPQTEVKP